MDDIKKNAKSSQVPGKWRQLAATLVVNLSALMYGTMMAWQSPMMPQLQSPNPPGGMETMTDETASWLGAIVCLGGFTITWVIGTISERFGRKFTGCMVALPFGICWILTIFATNHVQLFVARFCGGVGGAGVLFIAPLYVSEISSDPIRGMLGSLLILVLNSGILIGYILGAFLSFKWYAICSVVLPVIYLGAFICLPETPVYLVRRNRIDEATRCLMWLRGGHKSTVERELCQLLHLQNAVKEITPTKSIGISNLFRDRATSKGLIISLGLFGGQQLCGIFAVLSNTETIFSISGSSLSSETSTIIIGAIQVFGSYISTSLMERAGRKPLLLISCAGMCASHYLLGLFCFLQDLGYDVSAWSWIPIAALSSFMILYCVGMGPGPYVVSSEIFARDVSSLAITVSLLFVWFTAFVVMKMFGTLMSILNMYGCFFLLGTFCALTFVFILILIPETKSRSREDILNELNGSLSHLELSRGKVSPVYV